MPSPVKTSETSVRILRSASQLFARQGYHGTSTREIARLAGVSENTLFRHFDYKEDLFWSTLLWHTKGLRYRRDLQEGIAQCDSPQAVLPMIFELLADTANYRPELLRLIAVAFLELHWKAEAFCLENLSPLLGPISQYLTLSMQRGALRELDPAMLTTALMMSAVVYPGLSRFLGAEQLSHSGNREPARVFSRFWLEVLTPNSAPYPREVGSVPKAPSLQPD
jgi:AcrR family transcriptional regulator